MIATAGDFCEHAWWIFENYTCHLVCEYDEKKIKIFIHHTDSVCPFDAIEELDTLKLEFKDLSKIGFRDELELISFNLEQ